ncbi:MAG: Fe-S protein assembly co-chaperone HscB [Terriglobales bacterium]
MKQQNQSGISLLSNPEIKAPCWSCGETEVRQFCKACGKVQPPLPVDYFAFFGLPRKLNIDVEQLQTEFYELSRRLHPDVAVRQNEREREWSLEQSSQLNDAYRTLKDPIKRTEYVLRLEGVELEEQSKAATEKARASGEVKKQVVPEDLLEEVFELNMQVEELRLSRRAGENDPSLVKELEARKVELERKSQALSDELRTYWKEWDSLSDTVPDQNRATVRNKMADLLNRRSYIRNLVRDVNETIE